MNYIIYGLSKGMQDVVNECCRNLRTTHDLKSELKHISEHSSLTAEEKMLVAFEFGKRYAGGK